MLFQDACIITWGCSAYGAIGEKQQREICLKKKASDVRAGHRVGAKKEKLKIDHWSFGAT